MILSSRTVESRGTLGEAVRPLPREHNFGITVSKLLTRAISILAVCTMDDSSRIFQEKLRLIHTRYESLLKPLIPSVLIETLILAEDRRFHNHFGLDLRAIARAIWNSTLRGKISGGSTLEQQLARTITGHYERSLLRKLREILLASLIDGAVPKGDVPGLYLSVAYFGWCMNGIEQACRRLGIECSSMTQRQAASLVARLKYPEPEHPSPQKKKLIERRVKYLLEMCRDSTRAIGSTEVKVETNATHFDF